MANNAFKVKINAKVGNGLNMCIYLLKLKLKHHISYLPQQLWHIQCWLCYSKLKNCSCTLHFRQGSLQFGIFAPSIAILW